jgi:hypothetical protein
MKIHPLILENLTAQAQIIMPENIAKWCYSQHFANDYRAMTLLLIAIICFIIYDFIDFFKFDEFKLLGMTINKQNIKTEAISFIKYMLYIFCLLWLYFSNNWHFLDNILRFMNVIP